MATTIVPEPIAVTDELMTHYANVLANFKARMGIREAAEYIGVTDREIREAMNEGQLRYYRVGRNGRRTSPMFLAEYVERYRTFQDAPVTSDRN